MPKREALQPDGVAVPKVPYSPVVVSGDLVYTAGQAPFDVDGNLVSDDIAEQTVQTLRNLAPASRPPAARSRTSSRSTRTSPTSATSRRTTRSTSRRSASRTRPGRPCRRGSSASRSRSRRWPESRADPLGRRSRGQGRTRHRGEPGPRRRGRGRPCGAGARVALVARGAEGLARSRPGSPRAVASLAPSLPT